MKPLLKPVAAQVIVITGATSGIGLATARSAAERGAAVVLAARNEPALRALAAEIRATGGRAEYRVCDVSDPAQVEAVAELARTAFGGFDTWVNDAAAAVYGRLEDVPIEDQRRVFESTYWGMVNGSLTALRHLKAREGGGAIVTVGSILSDQATPLQGPYSAAKHAVKGFTNALRMELMRAGHPVSVTLIKPAAIDTPYKEHARNYLGHPATNPPPVYDPQLVADAILYAAATPVREISVGGAGKLLTVFGQLFPGLAEPLFAWVLPVLHRDKASNHYDDSDNLYRPGRDLKERAGTYPYVRRTSLYAKAQMNPGVTAAVLGALAGFALVAHVARDQGRLARARRQGRLQERAKLQARAARAAAKGNPRHR